MVTMRPDVLNVGGRYDVLAYCLRSTSVAIVLQGHVLNRRRRAIQSSRCDDDEFWPRRVS